MERNSSSSRQQQNFAKSTCARTHENYEGHGIHVAAEMEALRWGPTVGWTLTIGERAVGIWFRGTDTAPYLYLHVVKTLDTHNAVVVRRELACRTHSRNSVYTRGIRVVVRRAWITRSVQIRRQIGIWMEYGRLHIRRCCDAQHACRPEDRRKLDTPHGHEFTGSFVRPILHCPLGQHCIHTPPFNCLPDEIRKPEEHDRAYEYSETYCTGLKDAVIRMLSFFRSVVEDYLENPEWQDSDRKECGEEP